MKKVQINFNFLPWHVSAHLLYMSWIRIRIRSSPYGSGSEFYNTNPDPRIQICITDKLLPIPQCPTSK